MCLRITTFHTTTTKRDFCYVFSCLARRRELQARQSLKRWAFKLPAMSSLLPSSNQSDLFFTYYFTSLCFLPLFLRFFFRSSFLPSIFLSQFIFNILFASTSFFLYLFSYKYSDTYTPSYSHTPTCPQRIHTYTPTVPLFLSLSLYICILLYISSLIYM